MERRLAAILAADVVGYSRLMERDEAGTLSVLKARRKDVLEPQAARHQGRIFKVSGDGVLMEFGSAVDAVACAIELQKAMDAANGELPADRHIVLRIGVNLGDVIVESGDRYGDGVNIAARLEAMATPGGICISGTVHEHVQRQLALAAVDLGPRALKNIERPVHVYRIDVGKAAPAAPAITEKRTKPSIAVLPFQNMSGDPEQEYFSDGIAEDIITALSHFREFFVIARNTTFTYKGQPVRVDTVCRDLGVRYLVEGSVRKAGQRVRVTAQLIEGETGAHLWASRFDRDLVDIFSVQDEITEAIVTAVAPETMNAELKRSRLKKAEDLNAWERVLRARWHTNKLTQADNRVAVQLLQEAIVEAPNMAEAYSALAICHIHDMLHIWRLDTAAAIAAASEAAQQAVALDSSDANGLAVLGRISLFARKYDDAFDYLERAVRLNPNLADAHGTLAAAYGVSGDYAASADAVARALALSPRDSSRALWFAGTGIAAYITGRYEECIDIASLNLRDHPGYASSLRQLAAALAMLGRKGEADAALARLLDRMPGLTISQVRDIAPIRDPDAQVRWLNGLRKAGLPE
jgi:adenylate cyclase